MEIKHFATAGTLESSDCLVTLEPSAEGNHIECSSPVIRQYGEAIRATIEDVLNRLDVHGVKLMLQDKGALDCTIRSRVQTAVLRAADRTDHLPWGTAL